MGCDHIKDRLADYISYSVDYAERRSIETHLEECAECRQELDYLKSYYKSIREFKELEAPAGLLSSIHEELERPRGLGELWAEFVKRVDRFRLPLELAGLALATVLVIFLFSPLRSFDFWGKDGATVAFNEEESVEMAKEPGPVTAEDEKSAPLKDERVVDKKELEPTLLKADDSNIVEEPQQENLPLIVKEEEQVALVEEKSVESEQLEVRDELALKLDDEAAFESSVNRLNEADLQMADESYLQVQEQELKVSESYEVAMVIREDSSEGELYGSYDEDSNSNESQRKLSFRSISKSKKSESQGYSELEVEEESIEPTREEVLRELAARYGAELSELRYDERGSSVIGAVIKVESGSYNALVEELSQLGLLEAPAVDPLTVATTHIRIVLTFE